eukprot:TRINITY_DN7565_c0_g2_i1.p2 TRINITY_DN7565_c0_g2~~TRINITY_DN7565_c0_g2_i1.p2  ORF type:complete len:131 (-),score=24.93 TRINITY_DN7565_c0_g2_i1:24-416(-)
MNTLRILTLSCLAALLLSLAFVPQCRADDFDDDDDDFDDIEIEAMSDRTAVQPGFLSSIFGGRRALIAHRILDSSSECKDKCKRKKEKCKDKYSECKDEASDSEDKDKCKYKNKKCKLKVDKCKMRCKHD